MTNVLVTGCTGFIGSSLARRLVQDGYNVYGLVRHASGRDLRPLEPVLDRIRLVEGDLTQYHSVRSAINSSNPQFILHLGALTPVRLSFEDPFPYLSTNINGTVNLVHAISEVCPKSRLIFASTAEVYGWQERREPFKEDLPLNPASPYAVSKEAADRYVQMAVKVYGLRATVLRPNNTYGRNSERNFLTEYLISTMLSGETCYVGAPESVRDYMFVEDHVDAYILAVKSEKAEGGVFNVSPGNPVTNRELTETISRLVGFSGKIVYGSYPPGYPQRPAVWDPDYLVLDSSRIRKALRWKPSVNLEEGLVRTIESWRKMST
ncbi:GDP-mannose 4,6-dehydratase [Candidatus Bathyarchaeota archaeon]|nr:GDP-mannose 4,6-dehydratase [Candidatus Bathyarchaeota archaeon]